MTLKRLVLLVLVAAAAFLAAPASSGAVQIIGPAALQAWADESKAPTPDTTITVVEMATTDPAWPCRYGEGPTALGCIDYRPNPNLYASPEAWTVDSREFFLHETAHVFDAMHLTDADRLWFAGVLRESGPWLTPDRHTTPGETFADQYALCAIQGKRLREWRLTNTNDEPVYPKLHRRLCKWIDNAYVR